MTVVTLKNGRKFRWCTGCGCWHGPDYDATHHDMDDPLEEPTEKNFDGTPEEAAEIKSLLTEATK